MDGVGGTIENLHPILGGQISKLPTSTRKEFSEGAENLAPSIASLFLAVNEVLDEYRDITNALAILRTFDSVLVTVKLRQLKATEILKPYAEPYFIILNDLVSAYSSINEK